MTRSSIRLALLAAALVVAPLALQAADKHGDWHLNYAAANDEAKKSGKAVLMLFTGSDWCPPCKAQEAEIFGSAEFKAWAKDNAVLVELDFPRRKAQSDEQKKHNAELKAKYAPRGFPTVLILDTDGKEHARWVGYRKGMGTEAWIERAAEPMKEAKG